MPEAELNIVLKLLDQASGEIKKAMGDTVKESDKLKDKSKKASDEMNKNFLRLTLTVGGLIKAYRLMQRGIVDVIAVGRQMDTDFNKAFNEFEISVQRVTQVIAQQLIEKLKTAMKFWTEFMGKGFGDTTGFSGDLINAEANLKKLQERLSGINSGNFVKNRFNLEKIDGERKAVEGLILAEERRIETLKKQIQVEIDSGRNQFENNIRLTEAKHKLDEFTKGLKDTEALFLTGTMSASQYYQTIFAAQNNQIMLNQQAARQLQELAALTAQVNNTQLMNAQRLTQEQTTLLNEYKENYMAAHAGMAALTVKLSTTIRTGFGSALASIATGAATAKEAFAELGKSMIEAIVNFMAQKLIAWVLEKTLLAGTVAVSSAAAVAIAAAWAPAAAMVSLAMVGSNAGPAAGAIAGVNSLSMRLATGGLFGGGKDAGSITGVVSDSPFAMRAHTGGMILGDEVPIIAQTGEGILSRRGMSALGGEGNLNRLNQGQSAGGGENVSITINYPRFNSSEDMDELAKMLGLQLQKELRYARGL